MFSDPPPVRLVLAREALTIHVPHEISWDELAHLSKHSARPVNSNLLAAILSVKRAFPGAAIVEVNPCPEKNTIPGSASIATAKPTSRGGTSTRRNSTKRAAEE